MKYKKIPHKIPVINLRVQKRNFQFIRVNKKNQTQMSKYKNNRA